MGTPSSPVAPPCTPVSPIVCRRRSPAWLLPPSRSRSSLLPRGNTPSGSVAPSWLLCPPSRKCGSPSKSSTKLDPESFTANASKFKHILFFFVVDWKHLFNIYLCIYTSFFFSIKKQFLVD